MPSLKRTSTALGKSYSVSGGVKKARSSKSTNLSNVVKLKRIIESTFEKKEVMVYQAAANITDAGATYLLNGVAQGDDSTNRTGRSITHAYLEVTVAIRAGAGNGAGTIGDMGFWSLVFDRQPNNSLANFSGGNGIYDVTAGNPAGLAQRNTLVLADRFIVLRREDYVIGAPSVDDCVYQMKVYIDLTRALQGQDKNTKFSGTGATVASIMTGSLIFAIGGQAAGAGWPQLNFVSKYRFTDA